jgi:hypothetical protein
MKDKKETLQEYIDKIVTPIFNKVLQEKEPNRMMVGTGNQKEYKFLWQPHNYRLYFLFDKTNFIPPTSKTIYKTRSFKLINYGKDYQFDNWENCKITIRKNQVEVINKSHNKQWRLISANSIPQIKEKIDQVVSNLNQQAKSALNSLIKRFGGCSDLKIIKIRGEHGIHGIDYLDKIPEDMIIHDTIFKKVYKGKVEFYDPVNIKNTISNLALKDMSPEIAGAINDLGSRFDILGNKIMDMMEMRLKVDKELAINIKTHNKVFKKLDNLLSQKDLRKWL